MRRLAIIDPDGGQQPLYDESKAIAVVFNGEIYNHQELRDGLIRRGHTLRTGSDGEVIAHLYEEMGHRFLEHLNGVFAIALWDAGTQTALLARDKFGVKPLYTWRGSGGEVRFASEIRALLADAAVSRTVDLKAVDRFLTFRFFPAPDTPLRDVRKVEPGMALTIKDGVVRERPFGNEVVELRTESRADLVAAYSEEFERAVVRQMMSDRPIGVMLSGGVDSGAITAVLARHSPRVRTFTVGFADDPDSDETALARKTAQLFGAEHEAHLMTAGDYADAIPRSLAALEEPIGANSALATNVVAEMMRPTVPVALSGQGVDESAAGYWRHLGVKLAQFGRAVPGLSFAAAHLPTRRLPVRVGRGVGTLAADSDLDLLMRAYQLASPQYKRELFRPEILEELGEGASPAAVVEHFRGLVTDRTTLEQMLFVDTRLWLPSELLLVADKLSMAASVELRVPFLDLEFMRIAEAIPGRHKIRGLSRKSLHKQAMLRWLPREIVYRKERGWQTPIGQWFMGPLRPLLCDVLLDPGGLCSTLFLQHRLVALIDNHAAGRANNTRLLYVLLSLGLWQRSLPPSAHR
jgi:asparagine synthase (glutamine-hydrolysing)